jgi:hypothetical protein
VQIYFIELSYLLASILFILGLKGMSHPETAKRGMHLAEFGMLMAIVGTLMHTRSSRTVDTRGISDRFRSRTRDGRLGANDPRCRNEPRSRTRSARPLPRSSRRRVYLKGPPISTR